MRIIGTSARSPGSASKPLSVFTRILGLTVLFPLPNTAKRFFITGVVTLRVLHEGSQLVLMSDSFNMLTPLRSSVVAISTLCHLD
eukprot:IDg12879t1